MERCAARRLGLAVCLSAALPALTAARHLEGAEPGAADADRTLSPYFFVQSDDPSVDRLPLLSTSAEIHVAGVIADVVVTQVYKNEGTRPIEAVYVFPGSTRAAVYGMKMTVDERVIVAEIHEKSQARQGYERAREAGKAAALLELQRPNVFQMNVANILPGDMVNVELSYTELLIPTEGVYELVYPTVVGPRYSSRPAVPPPASSEQWVETPYRAEGTAPSYTFDLHASIAAGLPLQELSCPSHRAQITYNDLSSAELRLDPEETAAGNRDFVLHYRLVGDQIQSGVLASRSGGEGFFLLMVQPPRRTEPAQIPPREYIFIVDVSGSMSGFPLSVSKRLLSNLVTNLGPSDLFNVLLFSGGSRLLAKRSLPATPENLERAQKMIEGEDGWGGTELLPALKRAMALPRVEGSSRSVVVVTDGFVDVEEEAFELIRSGLGDANLFAFGIGSSVNRHLIEGMAHVGFGEPFVVDKAEGADEAAERFRRYVSSPVLTRVRVEYGGFQAFDVEPASIPDVLAERPIVVSGKWRGELTGVVMVSGQSGDGEFRQVIDVAGSSPASSAALRYLWARRRITSLGDYEALRSRPERVQEITRLGLGYNLLTAYTSFLAVDDAVRNLAGAPVAVQQPLPLPQGVSNHAVGQAPCGICETVEVVGETPLLTFSSGTAGEVITGTTVVALPLNGRNFAQLALLAPGVNQRDLRPFALPAGVPEGRAHVNGLPGQANHFVLDGIDMNEPLDDVIGYHPSLSALVELRVETANVPAEFGYVAGALLAGSTKSGTNELHGEASEFWRDGHLGANRWENNRSGAAKPGLTQHIFGGTFGGPLLKDRLFFFLDYQGTRIGESGAATASVAPDAWRRGDFSELLPLGVVLRDPLTGLPFPGNQIPVDRFSPGARALLADAAGYPLPNRPGRVGNFVGDERRTTHNDQADLKLEASFGPRDSLSLRLSFADHSAADGSRPLPLWMARSDTQSSRSLAAGWTRVQSPAMVNELRAGMSRMENGRHEQDWAAVGPYDARLGVAGVQVMDGLSELDWSSAGIDPIGSAAPNGSGVSTAYELTDKLSWMRGRHAWSAGGRWRSVHMRRREAGDNGLLGRFAFSGQFTGFAFSDFLLDQVAQEAVAGAAAPWTQLQDRVGLFVQDDYRLTPRLTLNLGVRWEYASPLREAGDRQVSYDLQTGQALFAGAIPTDVCAGYASGCARAESRGLYDAYYGGLSPRLGFAWSLDDRSVIRGGYGIVQYLQGPGANERLPQQPPFLPEDTRRTFLSGAAGSMADGLPQTAAAGLGTGELRVFQQGLKPQLTQQWSLFFERQLGSRQAVGLGYVGSRSSRLVAVHDANQPLPGAGDPRLWVDADSRRPLHSVIPGAGAVLATRSDGKARYDGLQFSLRRQYAKGWEFRLSYTLSRSLQDAAVARPGDPVGPAGGAGEQDSRHPEADYGPAPFDVTHNLVLSARCDLPWGRGRAHGSEWRGVKQALLGGWSVNAIFAAHSGLPLTVYDGWNVRSLQPALTRERPDRIAAGATGNFDWSDGADPARRWLDAAAFRAASPGSFGNSGIGILRGPGWNNLDLGLEKQLGAGGEHTLTLGLYAYNALNHANKAQPNTDWSDRLSFGTITAAANPPRALELMARVAW